MPATDSTTRLVIAIATAAVMMLVAWMIMPTVSYWQRARLANQLTAEIASAEDSAVKVPLRQLADLGVPAIEPLLIASVSQREAVASIARRILDEKMSAWQTAAKNDQETSNDHEYIDATTKLAKALSLHVDKLGPTGKQWAERLALAMIELSDSLPAQQSGPVLANCSRVLAKIPPRGPRLRTISALANSKRPTLPTALPSPQPRLEPFTRSSDRTLEKKQRFRTNDSLRFQGGLTKVQPDVVTMSKPIASELNWARQPHSTVAQQTLPPTDSTLSQKYEGANRQAPIKRVTDVPTPQEMQDRAAKLREFSSKELLNRLQPADFYEAGIIRRVLNERGFDDAELALMQQLASPIVADRLRLVDDVSRLPATTAGRIIRKLVDDQDPEVRLRALTALATANAPNLTAIARELAVRDEDARVAELASRLLKQVR